MTNKPTTTKPFALAAIDFSEICNRIDNAEKFDDLIKMEFDKAMESVIDAVDRRKYLVSEVDQKIAAAKEFRDKAVKAIKTFERIRDRVIENTKQVVESHPDIPFKDSLGKKLSVIKNPTPSLKITGEWDQKKFAKIIRKIELDKPALKEALLAGEEVDYAELEYGKQLRGMK